MERNDDPSGTVQEFSYTNKWYIHKPEFILKNATYKIPWDLKIQTNHQILARRPDLVLIYKKKWTWPLEDSAIP